jgi:hypothetical protein
MITHLTDLPASLIDDTARMNGRNKHKVNGQMNHLTAVIKANASVFFLTHIFRKNFRQTHKWNIWVYPIHKTSFRKAITA